MLEVVVTGYGDGERSWRVVVVARVVVCGGNGGDWREIVVSGGDVWWI